MHFLFGILALVFVFFAVKLFIKGLVVGGIVLAVLALASGAGLFRTLGNKA